MRTEQEQIADICLVLEGTYPYILGGVAAWVEQVLKGLPDFTFALYFLGSNREATKKRHYQLPPNVISLTEVFLHERLREEELRPAKTPAELREKIYRAMREFYLRNEDEQTIARFWELAELLAEAGEQYTYGNFSHDLEAWELLEDAYDKFCPDESFIDYFWTVRFLHLPTWSLLKGFQKLPPARLYHSVSAGYAGVAAAAGSRKYGVPFLLTEHGIYFKERIAEISQADWIYEGELEEIDFTEGMGKLKQLWIEQFRLQSQIAYEQANAIVTLFEGAVLTQIEFGADRKKTHVIPNGVDPAKFDGIKEVVQARWNPEPKIKRVGFVGRIVPIKDVKTLLRAARQVIERMPNVEFLLAGPYNEDLPYYEECQKILKLLSIEDKVFFLGPQKLDEVLSSMDVMVLTSISEGLPLVALEAMAAGMPVVATDVGACREMIFGRTPEDKALGRAGRLTKILSPQETALALVSILEHPETWRKLGMAGRARVERFYSMERLLQSYRELYLRFGAKTGTPTSSGETVMRS